VPWPNGFAVAVRAASRQERTTPFTVLLAGFAAVLARLSGQDDVLVATPVANRARAELDSVVGCFINTLPLRVIVDEDASFTALLRATRERVIDAQANAEVPFERVVAALDLQRGAVRSALFQSLLVMQNTPPWEAGDDEHRVEVVELPSPHTHYDLKLEVFGNDPALSARLVHATDVLGPPRARLLAGQLAAFLGRALMSPDAPINSLSLSGAAGLHDRPLPQEVP
jgi:non-ribosomal peptide synthetase component F